MSLGFKRKLQRCVAIGVLGIFAASVLMISAQAADAPKPATKKPLTELAAPFDLDKDGELSPAELKAFEDSKKANHDKRRQDELAKYDLNHDGKINKDEREKIKADKDIEKARVDAEKAKASAEKAKLKADEKAKTAKEKASKPPVTSATNAPAKP
ncbi:MAG: hypothetical protein ACAI35_14405 [Candidatus Methylacidiphilales bacterium]|nr:hypothetical protein [Candidatus Methylacidiphilales bacterium]